MSVQLDFFNAYVAPEPEPEYHWQGCFPEWMPKVGCYCSFDTTVYEGRGAEQIEGEADRRYCYMAELKILKIEGRNIDCVGVVRRYYGGCEAHVGKLYFTTMDEIWLATYITERDVPIEVITEEVIAEHKRIEEENNARYKRLEAMDRKAQAHNKKLLKQKAI